MTTRPPRPVPALHLALGLLLLGGCVSRATSQPEDSRSLASSPPACPSGQRPFQVVNQCAQTVWVGAVSGTMGCLTDADCPTSSSACVGANPAIGQQGTCGCLTDGGGCGAAGVCNTVSAQCFWNAPTVGQLQLDAGTSTTVCMPAAPDGGAVQWSGALYGRTGCDSNGQNCQTGDCGNGPNAPCSPYMGGRPPVTQVELTLSNQSLPDASSVDFYDVTTINGVSIGISMAPRPGTFAAGADDAGYWCGSPGAATQAAPLSGCSWNLSPTVSGVDQTMLLRQVRPGAVTQATCPNGTAPNGLQYCTCAADSDCGSLGMVCGLAMNAALAPPDGGPTPVFANVCGTQIAWWSANEICQTDPTFDAGINCAMPIQNTDGSQSTLTNLFACNGTQSQSCYSADAGPDCCGCATSPDAAGSQWPPPSQGFSCSNNNPRWVQNVLPWLYPLKNACPTAYSYPFDDATSTFTCGRASPTQPVAYTVTYCPSAP